MELSEGTFGRRNRRENELRLRLAVRAAQIGIWDWDLLTGEMNYSPRARAIYGFAPEITITPELVRASIHPDDIPASAELARRARDPAIRDKEPFMFRIIRADTRELRWVSAHGEALFGRVDGAVKAYRYIGTIQDVTEQKRLEDRSRESQARLQLAIDAGRMAVFEVDLLTEAVTVNRELNLMYGLPPDAQPTIAELRAVYAPGEQERLREAGRQAMAAGERHFEVEYRVVKPDGQFRWLLLRAEIIVGDDALPQRVIGVLMDIDERKRAEEKQALLLRELNHRVRNSLSVAQAIANQTFRGDNIGPAAVRKFRDRLNALAKANEVLLDQSWSAVSLRALIDTITAPYRESGKDPFVIDGADRRLLPHVTVPLGLAVHELCTNAAKFGALSADEGTVRISWSDIKPDEVELIWEEAGGPPVSPTFQGGFGSRLLSPTLSPDLGEVELTFRRSGLRCRLQLKVRPT